MKKNKYKIRSIPKVVFFREGTKMRYNGGYDAPGMTGWIANNAKAGSTKITKGMEEFRESVKDLEIFAIFFGRARSKAYETWVKVSREVEKEFRLHFFHSFDEDFAKELDQSRPSIKVFKKYDDLDQQYKGSLKNLEKIVKFLRLNYARAVKEYYKQTE